MYIFICYYKCIFQLHMELDYTFRVSNRSDNDDARQEFNSCEYMLAPRLYAFFI